MKKQGAFLMWLLMSFVGVANAIPSYSDVSGISSTLTQVVNWVCYGIGPGCVVLSVALFGFKLLSHDKEAWAHSKDMIIGSLVIALAGGIGKAIMALAQVQQ